MGRSGSLLYRCNLCRAEFSPVHVSDGVAVIRHFDEGFPPLPGANPPRRTEVHHCTPKRWGLAEVVGVQFDDPPETAEP